MSHHTTNTARKFSYTMLTIASFGWTISAILRYINGNTSGAERSITLAVVSAIAAYTIS